MKIVEINTVCGIGSTGRIAVDLAKVLSESGHVCEIAYGQFHTNFHPSYKIGNILDSFIHKLGSRIFDRQGFFSQRATIKLCKYLQRSKPDIIHLHNLHGHYLNIDILFQYLADSQTPVIWTLHDCWAFTGHCAYFDYANCNKWLSGCFNCPNKQTYPPSWIFDNSHKNYQQKKAIFNRLSNMALTTPSQWLADLVKDSFLSQYRVYNIPNGIDTDVFRPIKTELKSRLNLENKIILLGVALGGFTGRKGLHYFIELSKLLPKNYVIILVGTTPKEIKSLPHNIQGITQTNDVHELIEYYSIADIFVNPTLEDNFPTTNLEALSCGTPVITFDTGGSPEAINEKTGIQVEKGDLHSLHTAVLNMNKSFKEENTAYCRQRAVTKFDKHIALASYLELYNKILKEKR